MSKHRRAARVDKNQDEIVKALRKIPNLSVELGHDDILVGYLGSTYWFEIKDPEKLFTKEGKTRQSEVKPSQRKLHAEFRGHYKIVWKLDQILKEIGINPS